MAAKRKKEKRVIKRRTYKGHRSAEGIKFGMGKKKQFKSNGQFGEGNELWQLAARGQKKSFETPELLWEAFLEYAKWNAENPHKIAQLVKDGLDWEIAEVPKTRVMTLGAFCEFCGISDVYFTVFEAQERKNKAAYKVVIDAIKNTIRNQKFSGAVAGFFNATLISQDLGMVSKVDSTSGGQPLQPPTINIIKGDSPKFASKESDVDDKPKKR